MDAVIWGMLFFGLLVTLAFTVSIWPFHSRAYDRIQSDTRDNRFTGAPKSTFAGKHCLDKSKLEKQTNFEINTAHSGAQCDRNSIFANNNINTTSNTQNDNHRNTHKTIYSNTRIPKNCSRLSDEDSEF